MTPPKTPLLTVDCVLIDDDRGVLLIRRKYPPFAGALALPGGFVEVGETVEDACRREMLEETGVSVKALSLVGVYSNPHRDPRRHTCSVAFVARASKHQVAAAGSDAASVEWVKSWRRAEIAFDHRRIIADAYRQLARLTARRGG